MKGTLILEAGEHDEVIALAASQIDSTKFAVYTNPGGEKNRTIRFGDSELAPDVMLVPLGGKYSTFIIEVETDETVTEAHALEQWIPYSRLEKVFYLVVPLRALKKAKDICQRLGIAGVHFGYYYAKGSSWLINYEGN